MSEYIRPRPGGLRWLHDRRDFHNMASLERYFQAQRWNFLFPDGGDGEKRARRYERYHDKAHSILTRFIEAAEAKLEGENNDH